MRGETLSDVNEMNQEANAFARALLMPEFLLRPAIEKMGGIDVDDEKAVAALAKRFRVTAAQMILRIGELLSASGSPASSEGEGPK